VVARPGAVPRSLTPLIGRAHEVHAVAELFAAGQRLVTLTGPAGVGKTRLSMAVADQYRDQALFVALAPIVESEFVPGLIGAALALPDTRAEDLVGAICAQLGSSNTLLVLDNFEHVLDAAPTVSQLLAECAGLRVLATSRSPLRLAGERVLPVRALALPDRLHHHLDDLARYAAVQLLVARAEAACGSFALTAENAGSVVDICRNLDGLPLAIELAAARLRVLPPRALAERLERGLTVLSDGARDAPPRLRTMHDAIAWSYDLLTPPLQALFRRLGVFVGSWSLDAVEAACLWDLPDLDPLDGHASLLDQSLIRRLMPDGPDVRFEMLHVVREFALDRLAAEGETATVQHACATYLRQLARHAGAARGQEQERWHIRVTQEWDNIRASLGWALSSDADPADLEIALDLAGGLWFYWIHYSRAPGEARMWLTRALEAAPDAPTAPRARALVALGAIEWRQGAYAPAGRHLDECIAMFRQFDDVQGLGYALHLAGHVRFEARDYAAAHALFEQSQAALTDAGDVLGALPLIGDLGMVAYHRGDYASARDWFERCLRSCREHGVTDHAADSLNRLGDLARLEGDLPRAETLYSESLRLWRSVQGTPGVASGLHKLGQTARSRGDIHGAHQLLGESLAIQQEIGNTQGQVECLVALAGLALESSPAELAAELLGASEAALEELGAPLAPADAADFERDRRRARASLDTPTWIAAHQHGRGLGLAEALTLAMKTMTQPPAAKSTSVLSPRELEVAALVARGASNREIAAALTISDKTVANHIDHIMTKLDLRSRAQIAVWMVRQDAAPTS
jgi:non-specific serine/threonine protein kinase